MKSMHGMACTHWRTITASCFTRTRMPSGSLIHSPQRRQPASCGRAIANGGGATTNVGIVRDSAKARRMISPQLARPPRRSGQKIAALRRASCHRLSSLHHKSLNMTWPGLHYRDELWITCVESSPLHRQRHPWFFVPAGSALGGVSKVARRLFDARAVGSRMIARLGITHRTTQIEPGTVSCTLFRVPCRHLPSSFHRRFLVHLLSSQTALLESFSSQCVNGMPMPRFRI